VKRAEAILCLAALLGVAVLYLAPIGSRGLVGPDEPRYASVSRQMAESGDWITPELWGEPWFEKPVLLYWLASAARIVGFENFTRIPVALLSLGFLAYFYYTVRRKFGVSEARAATLILATSAGWIAFSDIGGADLPVSALTAAALLSLLEWVDDPREKRLALPAFGALLGLAVLSKGLVGPAIAFFAVLPLLWERPRRILDLVGLSTLLPFCVLALPWYLACYARNGQAFISEFIWKHHVERFTSPSLEHVQPFWFYLPVLLLFLLPWAPLLVTLRPGEIWADRRTRFLAGWVVGSMLFFSISVNKLPGYILPVLPPLAILLGIAWVRRPSRFAALVASASLLLVPLVAVLLPVALADGISKAWAAADLSTLSTIAGISVVVVSATAFVILRFTDIRALAAIALAATLLLTLLKLETYPAISQIAGAREVYFEQQLEASQVCIGDVRRHTEYGLRFYSGDAIPLCEEQTAKFAITGDPPRIEPRP
jgi:4-amino-4-deoxy-L-arabinose transferase-like glycosyltransferase